MSPKNYYSCWFYGCNLVFRTLIQRNRHFQLWHPQIKVELKKLAKNEVSKKTKLSVKENKKQKISCQTCGKIVTIGSYTQHRNRCINQGKKDILCPVENCQAKFATAENKRQHVYSVHKTAIRCPFEDCQITFKPVRLSRHVRTVHQNEIKVCETCGKEISYLNFKRHVYRCTGGQESENRFRCLVEGCEAKFATRANLNTHKSMVHRKLVRCNWKNCEMMLKPKSMEAHIMRVHRTKKAKTKEEKKKEEECTWRYVVTDKHKPLKELLNYRAYMMIKRKYLRLYSRMVRDRRVTEELINSDDFIEELFM